MNASISAGLLLVLAGATAGAQAVVQPPSGDTLPPFERPNGMLLRPGSFVYQLSLRQDTVVRDLGTRAVDVTEASLGGQPGWLVAESRAGTVVPTSDSLYLSRADLSPTRWIGAIGSARLAVSFTRDTMFGAMQSYQGRASFITDVPPGALLTAGMVDRIVELLPLQAGYRTGASLVFIELGTPRAVPAVIAVEREESVVLADKSVDCWVVRLTAGPLEERLWVSKESPRVVKTEQATATGVLTALLRPIQIVPEQPVAAFGNLPPGEPLIIPGSRPIYLPPGTFAPVQAPTSAPSRVAPPAPPRVPGPVRPR